MIDEITINLRALTEEDRKEIYEILRYRGFTVPDEINDKALEIIDNFNDE